MSIFFPADANTISYYSGTIANLPQAGADKTIFFRLKLSDLNGTKGFFNATDTTAIAYQIGIASGALRVWQFGGGSFVNFVPQVGVWIAVCYTYQSSGTVSAFYENGILKASSTVQFPSGVVNQVQLGGNQWYEPASNVYMEDIRIYNRVLPSNEILDLSNSQGRSINTNGLIAWWPMTDSGTVVSSIKEMQTNSTMSLVGSTLPIFKESTLLTRPTGRF